MLRIIWPMRCRLYLPDNYCHSNYCPLSGSPLLNLASFYDKLNIRESFAGAWQSLMWRKLHGMYHDHGGQKCQSLNVPMLYK